MDRILVSDVQGQPVRGQVQTAAFSVEKGSDLGLRKQRHLLSGLMLRFDFTLGRTYLLDELSECFLGAKEVDEPGIRETQQSVLIGGHSQNLMKRNDKTVLFGEGGLKMQVVGTQGQRADKFFVIDEATALDGNPFLHLFSSDEWRL